MKNFLKIYKHLGLVSGQAVSPQAFGSLQYKFLSPIERRDRKTIINYLINDGYIDENLKLTKKGEEYLYQ